MRVAIIDLGTITFNLLIAETTIDSAYKILLSTKEGVKLGEGGINRKVITEAAFQRGIDAIGRHFERMEPYRVDKIMAIATSAIRDAANGNEFTHALKKRFNLDVSIISGDKEAGLIHLGVKQTLPFHDKRYMILDIGGGSNEFIIADDAQIFWKQSFKLGMARLLERFQPADPITSAQIADIETYINKELTPMFENFNRYKPEIFVGASGSFDSFVLMMANENQLPPFHNETSHIIPPEDYQRLHQKLITSTREERGQIKGLEPVRRDLIVLASIFVNFVLKKTGLSTIYQSAYSLKEGAVLELISKS